MPREEKEFRQAHQFTIIAHDLGKKSGRLAPGQSAEVNCCLGVTFSDDYASIPGSQWQHMAGSAQIGWTRRRIGQQAYGVRPVTSGNPGGYSLRRINCNRISCPESVFIDCHHWRQSQLVGAFTGQGRANEPAGMTDNKPHHLLRCAFRGHDEIALVFAVLVVNDDYRPACTDLGKSVFYCFKSWI